MKKIIIPLFVSCFCFSSCIELEVGPTLCDCKENYWDPEDKKYGETSTLENTGKCG